jgi:hypothetical protein
VWTVLADATTTATAVSPWLLGVAGSIITALVGTIAYGVRAIIKGELVPRRTVDKLEASFDRSQTTLATVLDRQDATEEGLRAIEQALTAVTNPRERQ